MLDMTLEQAIERLGGVTKTSELTAIPRTTIHYWLQDGIKPPAWRMADVARIIVLAKGPKANGRAA